jgi:CubicO group peptidase (beta-lactamase class C family)
MEPISRRGFLHSTAALAAIPTAGRALGEARDQVVDRLAEETPYWLEASGTPGMTIALLERGRTRVVHCFGGTDPTRKTPITEATVFQAASLSKQALLYAALRAIELGKLDLDRPLARYFEKTPDLPPAELERVTGRMALTHTIGWPNWPPEGKPPEVVSPPGKWSYSGTGYVYLMHAMESILDEPAADFTRRLVFDPLGMAASSFVWRPDYDTLAVSGFETDGTRARQWRPTEANGAASLSTTARDYGRLLEAYLDPALQRRHRQVYRPQVAIDARLGWSLGWGTAGPVLWQWGHNEGFKAFAAIDPPSGRGIVCLTNGAGGQRVNRAWVDGWLGAPLPAFYFRMVDL